MACYNKKREIKEIHPGFDVGGFDKLKLKYDKHFQVSLLSFLVDIIVCKWVKETTKSLSHPTAVDEEKNNKRSVELLKLFNFLFPSVSFCVFISIFMILTSFLRKNIRKLLFQETIS